MPLNKRITTLRSKVDRDKSYPAQEGLQPVSYTHLTLPTIYSV